MSKDKKKNLDDWTPLVGSPFPNLVGHKNGLVGERNETFIDHLYDPSNEEHIYDFRNSSKAPLVRAYDSLLLKPPKKEAGDKTEKKNPETKPKMAVIT